MGRMATLIMVLSGILLLFYFGGLLGEEVAENNLLLALLLSPEDITISNFIADNLVEVLLTLGIAGIAVGLVLAGNLDLAVLAGVSLSLLTLLMSFVDVFNVVFSTNPIMSLLFLSPLIVLMVVTTLEWWRGTA